MTVRRLQPAWRFSRNELSGKPGAIHNLPDPDAGRPRSRRHSGLRVYSRF